MASSATNIAQPHSTQIHNSPATTGSWTPSGRFARAAAAPASAPSTAPTENMPCHIGMNTTALARSTTVPWTFIATSHTPMPDPVNSRITARTGTEWASGTIAQPSSAMVAATRQTQALEKRWTRVPAKGIAATEPIPTQTRAKASSVGEAPTCRRICGIRDTAEAMANPEAANTNATAPGDPSRPSAAGVPPPVRPPVPTRPDRPVARDPAPVGPATGSVTPAAGGSRRWRRDRRSSASTTVPQRRSPRSARAEWRRRSPRTPAAWPATSRTRRPAW